MISKISERHLLERIVKAWDGDDSMEFLAATFLARRVLGLKLSDSSEESDDEEVLRANGYGDEIDAVTQIPDDPRCEHGIALDVHCCACKRSGFFPPDDCRCYGDATPVARELLNRMAADILLGPED